MTDNLATALAAFQAELPTIVKDNTAKVSSDKGGYTYKYADLADVSAVVLPLLAKHGMSFSCAPTLDDAGRFVLQYKLRHAPSGDSIGGTYPLSAGSAQQVGSLITYARRYILCSLTGVAPDRDDDGAGAKEVRSSSLPVPRDQEWDPVEQQILHDAWLSEIEKARTGEEIANIGKQILKAKKEPGEAQISPAVYAKLAAAGGRRKAVLDQVQQEAK